MLTVYERKQLNNKNYENYFKAISNSNPKAAAAKIRKQYL